MPGKPYLIAIAGPSGSGKTTIAQHIASLLPATIFSLDSYYYDLSHLPIKERKLTNFDHPDSHDFNLLNQHLHELAEGKEIDRPIYDFLTHTRSHETERVRARDVLIVEGLFTLYWSDIRSVFGTKVFVEAGHEVCLPRRLARDVDERGWSVEATTALYAEIVQPMADHFINPTKQYADIILDGCKELEQSAATVLAHISQNRKP